MFSLIVPRRAVFTDFVKESECQWVLDVSDPGAISEIAVCLRQPLSIPTTGVGVYFSFLPFANWEFLGVLTNNSPSDLFSTGWALHPDAQVQPIVRIGLRVEGEAELLIKLQTTPPVDFKKEFARRVALNLFNYIESFSATGLGALASQPQMVLESWLKRFEEKYKIDPNFVMRSE